MIRASCALTSHVLLYVYRWLTIPTQVDVVVGTGMVTECATDHTVWEVIMVIHGETVGHNAVSTSAYNDQAQGRVHAPVIMLCITRVAVNVSVVKNVVSVAFAAAASAASSRLSSDGCVPHQRTNG